MNDEKLENILRVLTTHIEELKEAREATKFPKRPPMTLDILNKRVADMEKTMHDMQAEYAISIGKIERFASELSNTVKKIVESTILDNARKIMKNQTDEVVERVVGIVHSTYELSQEIKGKEVAKEFIPSRLSLPPQRREDPPQRREDPRYYPLSWHQAVKDEKYEAYALQQLATPLEIEEGTGNYGRCRALTRKGYRCQHRSPLTKVPTGHLLPQHYVRLEKYLCNSHDGDMGIDNDIGALMREKLDEVFGVD